MDQISSAQRRADTIFELRTPALILDKSKLEANAARMRDRARNLGVSLRPHVKTSKSIDVLRILSGGTDIPITVSTLAEAQYFFAHNIRDILYAVGIAPVKLPQVAELIRSGCRSKSSSTASKLLQQFRPLGSPKGSQFSPSSRLIPMAAVPG